MAEEQKNSGRKKRASKRSPRKITPQSLRNAALFYLQRYATSAENLRRVLIRRVERAAHVHGSDIVEGTEIVSKIITRYREVGLLNDLVYAETQAKTLFRRGTSSRAIRVRLHTKGVGREEIERALALLDLEVTEIDLVAAVILSRRRRLGPWRLEDRLNHRKRDLAILARRGFSYTVAKQVIDAKNIKDLEEL